MRRPITASEYILDRIAEDTDTGCWDWQRCCNNNGYGTACFRGKWFRAHRLSYEAFVGPIPEGLTIDHLCSNRRCVNPDHLEAVTARENNLRGETWGGINSRKTCCPKGHPYDTRDSHGNRCCSLCRKENAKRYQRRRRGQVADAPDRGVYCLSGRHLRTEENTSIHPVNGRICRDCRKEAHKRNYKPKGPAPKPTHCPKGHEYTPENTYTHARGYYCRECNRDASRRRWERKKD